MKTKTRTKNMVRSYTADWNHLRLVAIYSDGKLIIGLRAGAVTVGGNVLSGQAFPARLRKILEDRLIRYGWNRPKMLRELFQLADSSTSFWELHSKIVNKE